MPIDFKLVALIEAMNDRPIAFNRHYVSLGCGINGALMLSQMVYWSKRTKDKNGYFYKTQDEWLEETGLTRYEQEGARKKLKELNFISEHKHGVPCKVHFKVNHEALYSALIQYVENQQTGMLETNKLDCGKPAYKGAENQQTNTENTTNITSEITTDISNNRKSKFNPINSVLPLNVEKQDWIDFVEMRNSIKKPLSELATKKILKKLEGFGIHAKQAIENSIVSSWSDVYMPKQNNGYSTPQSRQTPSMSDYMQKELMRDITPEQQYFLEHEK